MADEKEALTESQKQTGAGNALETRRLRKLAAEQQQERRAWLFAITCLKKSASRSSLSFRKSPRSTTACSRSSLKTRCEMARALRDAIEKYGYHHVLAALESGEVSAVYSGAIRALSLKSPLKISRIRTVGRSTPSMRWDAQASRQRKPSSTCMAGTSTSRVITSRRPEPTARSKLGRANPLGERPTQSVREAHADETENGDSQGGGGPPVGMTMLQL